MATAEQKRAATDYGLQQVNAITNSISRLDNALKLWAVKTYGLTHPGPPPQYAHPWQPKHLVLARGWEGFKANWHLERKRSHNERYSAASLDRMEGFALGLVDFRMDFEAMGVRPNDAAVAGLEKPKQDPMPWSNTALILGIGGIAAWIAMPKLRGMFDSVPKPLTGRDLNDARLEQILTPKHRRSPRAEPMIMGPSMRQVQSKVVRDYMQDERIAMESGPDRGRRMLPQSTGRDSDEFEGDEDEGGDDDDY